MDERRMLAALTLRDDANGRLEALADALQVPDGAVAFYAFGAPRDSEPPARAPRSTRVVCAPEARGWWADYCADSDRHARDPVRMAIRTCIVPVYWNALVSGAEFARSGSGLWQHLRDHRITAGVSVPLHDTGTGRYGAFSLLQFGSNAGFASWLAARTAHLCAAAFAFHLSLNDDEAAPTSAAALTPREAQCLGLVAEDLTSKQIARRFDLSPRTVDLHLARACRRLGVATRAQAVARALRDGSLVVPAR